MLEIAKILKPQGIKGEVKALPLTNVLAVFNSIKSCVVGNIVLNIENVSLRQGYAYIKFKEISTRNEAEKLRNYILKVEKDVLEEIKEENEFLVDDLIGMILYDDKKNLIGQIVDIMNYGACDIFIIEKDGRKYQVPYVDDVFRKEGNILVVDSEKIKEVMI